MYALPPSCVSSIGEDTQLEIMMNAQSADPEQMKLSWLSAIDTYAKQQNISFNPARITENGQEKLYVFLSCNPESIDQLVSNDYKDFDKWRDWNKHRDRGVILLDKVAIDVSSLDRQSFFALNSYVCQYIQHMSIAKTAFENEGYPLPDHVAIAATRSIWELDQMRANEEVPKHLRARYEETYHQAVADYAQRYTTKYKENLIQLPNNGQHCVSENYFKENFIECTWESVTADQMKFIKEQLQAGRYPELIYFKEDKAYFKKSNLAAIFEKKTAKMSKEQKGPNFWKNDTGETRYRICYPTSQAYAFGQLFNEYNARNMEHATTAELTQKTSAPLQLLYVHSHDLQNWNSLAKANGVEWALDDGSVGKFDFTTENIMEKVPILYRAEDMKMVGLIVKRLSNEAQMYTPISKLSQIERDQRLFSKPLPNKNNKGMDL